MRVRDDRRLPLALALMGVLAGILAPTPGAAADRPDLSGTEHAATAVRAVPGPAGDDDGRDGTNPDGAIATADPAEIGLPWLSGTLEALVAAERERAGLTGPVVPAVASGELVTVAGNEAAPRDAAVVRQVRVQFEEGLAVDGEAFADFVMGVLNDERGWGHDGSVAFARTDGPAEISVVVASGSLTDELCVPLRTMGEYSCGRNHRAVLNAERWSDGAEPFLAGGGSLTEYRQYLVNHEVGHLLGRPHTSCPAEGEIAPVMLQQSLRMEGCVPNAWPAR